MINNAPCCVRTGGRLWHRNFSCLPVQARGQVRPQEGEGDQHRWTVLFAYFLIHVCIVYRTVYYRVEHPSCRAVSSINSVVTAMMIFSQSWLEETLLRLSLLRFDSCRPFHCSRQDTPAGRRQMHHEATFFAGMCHLPPLHNVVRVADVVVSPTPMLLMFREESTLADMLGGGGSTNIADVAR